jgi:nucleoid DNA-binding protein/nucleoid-associated protein YgaU
MIYEEFIAEVAGILEWTEEQTAGVIETIVEVMTAELKMNNPVVIDDFGTLKTEIQPEYILVNPETKERHLMPPAIEVVFEASFQENEDGVSLFTSDDTLYDELNASFSQFEPTPLNEGVQFSGIPEIVAVEPEQTEPAAQVEFAGQAEPVEQTDPVEYQATIETEQTPAQTESFGQTAQAVAAAEGASPRNRSSRRGLGSKKKISPVWIPVVGGIAIIVAVFFFLKWKEAGKAGMIAPSAQVDFVSAHEEETDTVFSVEEPAIPPVMEPVAVSPQKEPEKAILLAGKTLRLLAEDIYGNREFWVYIYLENKDKIRNPNKVSSGMELLLPDKAVYSIDAADPQSVAKAKSLGDAILEKF